MVEGYLLINGVDLITDVLTPAIIFSPLHIQAFIKPGKKMLN